MLHRTNSPYFVIMIGISLISLKRQVLDLSVYFLPSYPGYCGGTKQEHLITVKFNLSEHALMYSQRTLIIVYSTWIV